MVRLLFLTVAPALLAQVPANQLASPPANAQKFVIVSAAGQHGTSALWTSAAGDVFSRESLLLRGMVWELDESVHFGSNGQPDRIVIRGVTPTGDAAETFAVSDREARWKSPVDTGSKAYDGASHYVPQGGTMSSTAVLAEKLYAAPGQKLKLLPAGEARLVKLTDLTLGVGPTAMQVSAYAIEGLSLNPFPIWLDKSGKFFGFVQAMGILPAGYAGDLLKLQKAQNDALAGRAPALARRFGAVASTPVAFTNTRVFDADAGRFVDNQTVIVDKGLISASGPSATVKLPANARVIDGSGKTLVPGLWDSHMHVADDSTGPMLLSIGVTSARDPGALVEPTIDRARRIAKGELLFPHVYPSVLIDGKGPLMAQGGVSVSSAAEGIAAVKMAREKGFTGVKFYGSMKPEWLFPSIAEAKKQGLHVHGHVPATMRPADAIAAGYDEITHINMVMMQAMPDEVVNQSNGIMRFEGPGRYARNVDIHAEPLKSLVADMAKKHITVDPTLVTFESLYVPENGDLSPAYAPYAASLPPATARGFLTGGFTVPKDLTRADYRSSFGKMIALAAELHKAHVPIVAGTDGMGIEIVRELELYVQAGLTPAESLQAAT
jgi:imidazolonepropionase-like amidohydrolase